MSLVILEKPRMLPASSRRAVMTTLAQNSSRLCAPASPRPRTALRAATFSSCRASPVRRRPAGKSGEKCWPMISSALYPLMPFCAGVPRSDPAFRVEHEDGVIRRPVDQQPSCSASRRLAAYPGRVRRSPGPLLEDRRARAVSRKSRRPPANSLPPASRSMSPAVTKMMGVCRERSLPRIALAVSKPLIPGMRTSSRTTANSSVRTAGGLLAGTGFHECIAQFSKHRL